MIDPEVRLFLEQTIDAGERARRLLDRLVADAAAPVVEEVPTVDEFFDADGNPTDAAGNPIEIGGEG